MKVSTAQITWGVYKGHTKVTMRFGCTYENSLIFPTRHDAAVFLAALRKRVR